MKTLPRDCVPRSDQTASKHTFLNIKRLRIAGLGLPTGGITEDYFWYASAEGRGGQVPCSDQDAVEQA